MTSNLALHRGHFVSTSAQRTMHGTQKRCAQPSSLPRSVTSSWQMTHTSPNTSPASAASAGIESRGGARGLRAAGSQARLFFCPGLIIRMSRDKL